MHWQRVYRGGDTGTPHPSLAPAGTGYVNPDGYRVFRVDHPDIKSMLGLDDNSVASLVQALRATAASSTESSES